MVNLQKHNVGFDYWTFQNFFMTDLADRIIAESEHFEYFKLEKTRICRMDRIYMNQYDYSSFQEVCTLFDSNIVKKMFSDICGTDFTNLGTRIELCKDAKDSYLVEHYDDPAKLATIQIYLSDTNVSTTLGKTETQAIKNAGWFFANTGKELHSLSPLTSNRTSIIVNWVDERWRDRAMIV